MVTFLPYMTNDFSVGLFNEEVNDIYHSAYGALSEAFEKFLPALDILDTNNLNVLDICYGIGYNSKALISNCLDKDYNIKIDCVDIDKTLMELSPFISSNINLFKRFIYKNKLTFNINNYNAAKKIINIKSKNKKYKINKFVNYIILKNLISSFAKDNDFKILSDETEKILLNHKNRPFFDLDTIKFYKFLSKKRVYLYQNKNISTFVHNIYYNYISNSNKIYKKLANSNNINLKFYSKDIRLFLKNSNNLYNLVFLDGFTPAKCPSIWSVEFFTELFNHLSDDGVIITYNMSAPVRHAMIISGFFIGNVLDSKNKKIGTVAIKNKSLIKNKLTEKEMRLLNTKAGIPYRDENLSLENDIILINRENEIKNANLITSSKYFKELKNEI